MASNLSIVLRSTRVIAAAFRDESEAGLSTVGAEDHRFPEANDALVDDRFGDIEKRVGRSVTLAEAAAWLGFTEEAIRLRIKKRKMIGFVVRKGARRPVRFPMFQFRNDRDVEEWVPKIISAYGANDLALLDFLTRPMKGSVAGKNVAEKSILDLLRSGEVAFALEVAALGNPD